MVLLALLRSYATNFRSATDDHGGIIALEEPELYMHPQARRHMSKVLREIAEAGMQVR
jgi:putative ATP-dependent endonuclease of OLD family